jgi:hypothetical protein
MKQRYTVQIGQVFSNLTILGILGWNKHGHLIYRCKCQCGQIKNVQRYHLLSGQIKSCGCLWRESILNHAKGRRKAKGAANARGLYTRYRYNTIHRGHEFSLTEAEFLAITVKPCHYCGQPPSSKLSLKGSFGAYTFNGLDRIDNKKGYVPGNVQPCCKQCNRAKGTLSHKEFMAWVKRLIKHSLTVN